MKYCCLKCEAEAERPVQVCPNCAVGQDAWHLWFEANDLRFAATAKDFLKPVFDTAGRIRKDYWDAVHGIINAKLDGVVSVKNIGQAMKLHLQKQADVARQQQEAAENIARHRLLEREQDIAAREFIVDHWFAHRLQAGQKQTIIQRLVAKLRKMISSPLPS